MQYIKDGDKVPSGASGVKYDAENDRYIVLFPEDEIEKSPNWDGFLARCEFPLMQLIVQITDPVAKEFAGTMKIEFANKPNIDIPRLMVLWNNSIASVEVYPATETFLNNAAIANDIPLRVSNGIMTVVQ